jgi:peptidoglycan/LPS O-acetylase OafA/YrhL
MRSRNIAYIPALDHIRGLAAIFMVGYHGLHLYGQTALFGGFRHGRSVPASSTAEAVLVEGHTAVALFMVLSGFIFAFGSRDVEVRYGSFLRNRALRVLPLMTFLIIVGTYTHPQGFSLLAFLQHFVLLSNVGDAWAPGAYTAMLWTISVECQFYLIFPRLLAMFKESRWHILGVLLLMLALRGLAQLNGANVRDLSYSTIVGRLDQFVLGMALGLAYRPGFLRGAALKIGALVAALALAVVALRVFNLNGGWLALTWWKGIWVTIEGAVWALFLAAYLEAATLIPALISRGLALLGHISYSVYLIHFLVLWTLIGQKWFVGAPDKAHVFRFALVNTALVLVPITLAFSTLTYWIVERPFLALRGVYVRGAARAPAASPSIAA